MAITTFADAVFVAVVAVIAIRVISAGALFMKRWREKNDGIWEWNRKVYVVRKAFTEQASLVEEVMSRCYADWRHERLFLECRGRSLRNQRLHFCALALEAAHKRAVIEAAFLTREFLETRWPLIHALPADLRELYREEISHYQLDPDQDILTFAQVNPEGKTYRERQEELSSLREIPLPEGERERHALIKELANRFVAGEVVFTFRRYNWREQAERAGAEGEAQERPT